MTHEAPDRNLIDVIVAECANWLLENRLCMVPIFTKVDAHGTRKLSISPEDQTVALRLQKICFIHLLSWVKSRSAASPPPMTRLMKPRIIWRTPFWRVRASARGSPPRGACKHTTPASSPMRPSLCRDAAATASQPPLLWATRTTRFPVSAKSSSTVDAIIGAFSATVAPVSMDSSLQSRPRCRRALTVLVMYPPPKKLQKRPGHKVYQVPTPC